MASGIGPGLDPARAANRRTRFRKPVRTPPAALAPVPAPRPRSASARPAGSLALSCPRRPTSRRCARRTSPAGPRPPHPASPLSGARPWPTRSSRAPSTRSRNTRRRMPQRVRAPRATYAPASAYAQPVVVRFKAVGNAPIMKQNFYKITASNRFQAVIQFLRKELGWKATDPLVRASLL
jgi:hypothetical protein